MPHWKKLVWILELNATLEKTRVDFGIMQGLMQVGWSEWVEWTENNCGPVAGKCRVLVKKMVKFRSCHWNGMATGMLRNNSDWFSEMLGCSSTSPGLAMEICRSWGRAKCATFGVISRIVVRICRRLVYSRYTSWLKRELNIYRI